MNERGGRVEQKLSWKWENDLGLHADSVFYQLQTEVSLVRVLYGQLIFCLHMVGTKQYKYPSSLHLTVIRGHRAGAHVKQPARLHFQITITMTFLSAARNADKTPKPGTGAPASQWLKEQTLTGIFQTQLSFLIIEHVVFV